MNKFYVYLNNLAATACSGVPGADYVPEDFRPVSRHSSMSSAADLLFGSDAVTRQYWITRVRQIIRGSPLESYISLPHREGGYRIDWIADMLAEYAKPRLSTGALLASFGNYRSSDYTLSKFNLSEAGGEVTAYTLSGRQVASAALVNDQARLVLFPATETGVVVGLDQLPAMLTWASLPKDTVSYRMKQLQSQLVPLLSAASSLDSIFEPDVVRTLISQTELSVQRQLAFAAAALLVAGHTAAVAGDAF